jgi:hypothetical protein
VQICRSRLSAVLCWANATAVTMAGSMRPLTHWRLKSPLPGRARRRRHMGFGCLQRPSLIPTLGSENCCGPLSSAERFVSLRAEMASPNPGLRAGARRMVRPVLGSADHATSRAGPAFGTFASAEAPKRSSHSWRRSPGQRHGPLQKRSALICIDYRCSNAVQSPPDSELECRRRCGPRRRPRSTWRRMGDGVR